MDRQKIKMQIEQYSVQVEHAIRDPIIYRDLGRTPIDTAKAFFTLLPLLNGEIWTAHTNTAAIAIGAVHAAFEAHDSVDEVDASSKGQQLTVLSGDHFSGIHYRLLASIPAFGFIRSLSGTIGQINEMKTNCHDQPPGGAREMMDAIRTIESGCITDFLHTFGFSRYVALAEAALPLLRLDSREVKDWGITSESELYRSWKPDDVERSIAQFHAELQEAIDTAGFLAPVLKQEISKMARPLLGKPI